VNVSHVRNPTPAQLIQKGEPLTQLQLPFDQLQTRPRILLRVVPSRPLLDILLQQRLRQIPQSRLERRSSRVLEEDGGVDDPRVAEFEGFEIGLERVAEENGAGADDGGEKGGLDVGEGEGGGGEGFGGDAGPSREGMQR
jgi:hypothetical protein